jgi:ribonucleoside-triphosphate reductase
MNEMCVNLFERDIVKPSCKEFAEDVLDFMRGKLQEYQEETGNLYNLEATPAESTCYRLAKLDKQLFPDIYTQGTDETPYYTNSCHIPVNRVTGIIATAEHQNNLQKKHTGGTVIHYYLDGPISASMAKRIVFAICTNFEVPYISISPLNCFCPEHGLLPAKYEKCPHCGQETEMYQRITGYRRNIKFFNEGKLAEFKDRNQLRLDE